MIACFGRVSLFIVYTTAHGLSHGLDMHVRQLLYLLHYIVYWKIGNKPPSANQHEAHD